MKIVNKEFLKNIDRCSNSCVTEDNDYTEIIQFIHVNIKGENTHDLLLIEQNFEKFIDIDSVIYNIFNINEDYIKTIFGDELDRRLFCKYCKQSFIVKNIKTSKFNENICDDCHEYILMKSRQETKKIYKMLSDEINEIKNLKSN